MELWCVCEILFLILEIKQKMRASGGTKRYCWNIEAENHTQQKVTKVLQISCQGVRGIWSFETGFSEVWGGKNLLDRWENMQSICPEEKKKRNKKHWGEDLTNITDKWQGKSNRIYLTGKRDAKVSMWNSSIWIHSTQKWYDTW